MVLKGYYDGSGQEGTKFYTLAGCVASAETWQRFEKCWMETLSNAPRPCAYLHMKKANRQRDAFDGWTKQETKRLIHSLIQSCIFPAGWGNRDSSSLCAVYCVIDDDDYKRACIDIPALKEKTKSAICAEYIAEVALRRLPQDPDESPGHRKGSVELYFDRNELFEREIRAAWDEAKRNSAGGRGYLSMITHIGPAEMRVTPGIQAADFLAWHVNRWHTKKKDSPAESQWANLTAVLSCGGVGDVFGYDKLMEWYGS